MIRKILALCLVLVAVSTAFTGCKKEAEPDKTGTTNNENVDHNHDADDGHTH